MINVTFNGFHEEAIAPVDPALVVATGEAVCIQEPDTEGRGRRATGIWHEPATLLTGQSCYKVYNCNTFTPENVVNVVVNVEAIPDSVTPRQIRLALNAMGLRTTVENTVKAGNQDLKDWWEYALEIERHHPMIESMGAQLGQSPEQIDALFTLAATL